MAVVNRTLDASQQKHGEISGRFVAADLVNGVTRMIGIVETPCVVTGGQMAVSGISGAPAYSIVVSRFVVGTGYTTFTLGTSQIPVELGTSGVLTSGLSLPASGSTLLNLQANDVLLLRTNGGTGAAAVDMSLKIIVRPIQDVKQYFGGNA